MSRTGTFNPDTDINQLISLLRKAITAAHPGPELPERSQQSLSLQGTAKSTSGVLEKTPEPNLSEQPAHSL